MRTDTSRIRRESTIRLCNKARSIVRPKVACAGAERRRGRGGSVAVSTANIMLKFSRKTPRRWTRASPITSHTVGLEVAVGGQSVADERMALLNHLLEFPLCIVRVHVCVTCMRGRTSISRMCAVRLLKESARECMLLRSRLGATMARRIGCRLAQSHVENLTSTMKSDEIVLTLMAAGSHSRLSA